MKAARLQQQQREVLGYGGGPSPSYGVGAQPDYQFETPMRASNEVFSTPQKTRVAENSYISAPGAALRAATPPPNFGSQLREKQTGESLARDLAGMHAELQKAMTPPDSPQKMGAGQMTTEKLRHAQALKLAQQHSLVKQQLKAEQLKQLQAQAQGTPAGGNPFLQVVEFC